MLHLAWVCLLLPLLLRSKQPGFGWQVLHNASGSWENDVEYLPLTLSSSKSAFQQHRVLCLTPLPTTGVGLLPHPPARTWKVVLGMWPYKHGPFSTLSAWLVWGQHGDTFSPSGAVSGGTVS